MTALRLRAGAIAIAAILTTLSAGCADHRSVLAPTDATSTPGLESQAAGLTGAALKAVHSPALSLFNSDFHYTYPRGTYSTDPQYQVLLRVDAGTPVTVNWVGRARGGARIHSYRWALDILDVLDETPRINEATDLSHWSQRSLTTVSATVGPFGAGASHVLYVDVMDTNGLRSLGMVRILTEEPVARLVRRCVEAGKFRQSGHPRSNPGGRNSRRAANTRRPCRVPASPTPA